MARHAHVALSAHQTRNVTDALAVGLPVCVLQLVLQTQRNALRARVVEAPVPVASARRMASAKRAAVGRIHANAARPVRR